MRAGRGVIHDESPDEILRRAGGHLHGVQVVDQHAEKAPSTPSLPIARTAQEIPLLPPRDRNGSSGCGGASATSPARPNFGRSLCVQASLTSGSTLLVDVSHPCELALYVMTGAIAIAERPSSRAACPALHPATRSGSW